MGIKDFFEVKHAQITSKNFPDFIKDRVMDELAKIAGWEEISNNKLLIKTKIKKFFIKLRSTQEHLELLSLNDGWDERAGKYRFGCHIDLPVWNKLNTDEENAVYRKYYEKYVIKCARDIRRHLR